jgi:hypothetical protein
MSRTVDRFRLVDEMTVSFTHDRTLPWLLPGVSPAGRRAEVLAIAIVGFERGRIRWQRIHWDHATLARQLGIPAPAVAETGAAAVTDAAPASRMWHAQAQHGEPEQREGGGPGD